MKHVSTKTYGHDLGLSACFRQWRAESHCRYLHGYALSFRFEFGADELDSRNWVIDFGALKPLKERLCHTFDHKLVIAGDDPHLSVFNALNITGVCDALILPEGVGCEKFARLAYGYAREVVYELGETGRVAVLSCECAEHGANSAIYRGWNDDEKQYI